MTGNKLLSRLLRMKGFKVTWFAVLADRQGKATVKAFYGTCTVDANGKNTLVTLKRVDNQATVDIK